MTVPCSPVPRLRAALTALALTSTLLLASCGGGNDNPFAGKPAPEDGGTTPAVSAGQTQPEEPIATAPSADVGSPPVDPLPSSPAAAPSPDDSTPAQAPAADATELEKAVAEDEEAKLNARTMVSIIEGCHSGRESYKDCNTHDELGSPKVLGIQIGKGAGEVKISATPRGFRVTANSESGAKFTVARGPAGDRFKCLPGPTPGACPADRTWSW